MENSNFSQRPKFELGFIQNSVELLTRGIQKNFATCRNSPKLAGTDRNWEERGQTPVSGSGSGGYLPLVSRSMRGSTERLKPGLRLGCSSESLKLLMHPQSTKITRDPPIHAPLLLFLTNGTNSSFTVNSLAVMYSGLRRMLLTRQLSAYRQTSASRQH